MWVKPRVINSQAGKFPLKESGYYNKIIICGINTNSNLF